MSRYGIIYAVSKTAKVSGSTLFDDTPPAEKSRLYAAVDALNARYGKSKVFSAWLSLRSACSLPYGSRTPARGGYAQGLGARSWHMKRQKLSSRPTTRWDELMAVR